MAKKFYKLSIWKEPQCLISTTTDGKLEIEKLTLEELKQLDKPLVVVAIAGLYRTGKSYLLNRLAGRNSGFALGSTIQSKTKGIWIWAVEHPKNSDYHLLLMDTEGLGDAEKGDANHDCWIFCLATVLSSVLVYNATGSITEDALGKLNFITEMSKYLRAKNSDTGADDADFDWYFPTFVFALRDFTLKLEIDGHKVTADQYMEHCLELKKGSDSTLQKSNPRACLRKYFKTRRCFTFDRPTSRTKLENLEQLQDGDLSEDFLEETNIFCAFIYKEAGVKKLDNGTKINGKMLASLIKEYVDAIRNGTIPCIENAVVSMAKSENTRLSNEALNLYTKEMNSRLILPTPDDSVLRKAHGECLKLAVAHFVKGAVADHDNRFQQQLNEQIQLSMENFVLENEAASTKKCGEYLAKLNKPIAEKLKSGVYATSGGFQKYQQDCFTLQSQYQSKSGLGVKKNQVLLDFINEKIPEGEVIMAADQQVSREEKKAEAERQQTLEMERKKEAAERERDLQKQFAEEKQKALELNMQQIHKKMEEERAMLKEHFDRVIMERQNEQQRLAKEGLQIQRATEQFQIELLKQLMQERLQPVQPQGSSCTVQ